MAHIEIKCCVTCGLLQPALKIEEALLNEFGQDIDAVALTTGPRGILSVRMDDDTLYNNQQDGPVINLNQLKRTIDNRLAVAQ